MVHQLTSFSSSKLSQVMDWQGRRVDWLAEQLGVDASYVSKMRSGERAITPELAARIARVLGIPVEFLIDDTTETANVA